MIYDIHIVSYIILHYYHAGMNDNTDKTKENSKKPSQIGDNNKDQPAIVSKDIKNRIEGAIIKPNIDGDPTRSDE